MISPSRRSPQEALKVWLKGRLFCLAGAIRHKVTEPVTVSIDDDLAHLELLLSPAGSAVQRASPHWMMLSPFEARLVEKLQAAKVSRPDDSIIGKRLAALCGVEYDSTFRVLLKNLVDRRIVLHDDTDGYAVSSAGPGPLGG